MKQEIHTIDATGKVLGRLAVQISILLRGKHKRDYILNRDMGDVVIVKNIKNIKITGKKMEQKKYYHHTGYMGGLKEVPIKKLFDENPGEILKRAIFGMLPKNKLRSKIIKRLKYAKGK